MGQRRQLALERTHPDQPGAFAHPTHERLSGARGELVPAMTGLQQDNVELLGAGQLFQLLSK